MAALFKVVAVVMGKTAVDGKVLTKVKGLSGMA